MTVPGISRTALVVLVVVALALFAAGTVRVLGILTAHTNRTTRTFAAAPTIVVDADIGDVDVVGSDRADVRLVAEQKRALWGGGHVKISGDAAHLRLDDGCDGLPSGIPFVYRPCQVHYRLEVPRGAAVRVNSDTGDLTAQDLRGATELTGATGRLKVRNAKGPLQVHSSTGAVDVDAASPEMTIRSSTGDVVVVASDPSAIDIRSDTGDIILVVPDQAYDVDARTQAGNTRDLVRHDNASPRRLVAHSTAGNVMLVSNPAMG